MSDIEIGAAEKMPRVIEAAYLSPDVALIGGIEETRIVPGTHQTNSMWQKTLDIYTCLKEPSYDPDKLNEVLEGIVPEEVERTDMADHFMLRGEFLYLGKLYFDDVIGKVTVSTSVELLPHLEAFEPGSMKSWDHETSTDLQNRTWLRVFPDRESLAKVFTENAQPFLAQVPKKPRRLQLLKPLEAEEQPEADPTKDPEVQEALNSPTINRVISDLEYMH